MSEAALLESLAGSRVFVAGADTMLGGALVRALGTVAGAQVCGHAIGAAGLRDRAAAEAALRHSRPTHVIIAAGRAGGITRNRLEPADLMLDNLQIASALIPAAHACGVSRLLYLASSCIYPRTAPQPMRPEALGTGPLEPTSAAYATAKIAGLTLCHAYRQQHGVHYVAAIPGDAYGPGDDVDPEHAHVVAGLIRRMHDAHTQGDPSFSVWGSGRQIRDLIYVDDLAAACLIALARHDAEEPINLSNGEGVTIAELAATVRAVVGFEGAVEFDTSRPDGAPMKVLDAGPIRHLGFTPRTTLRRGLEQTYAWFLGRVGEAARASQ
jgi:GDP-L-fucose synthase